MKSLADHIHGKGLKLGLYSSAGTFTCQGRAGGLDHEDIDAQDYAKWGVDYLKYDNCFNQGRPAHERYTRMKEALNKTGRPIFYSVCNWGEDGTERWGPSIANSWRTSADIANVWGSVVYNFDVADAKKFRKISGPGGWNDPDMLELGNGVLSHDQEKTHFALWSFMKAPLIIGCDLATVSNKTLSILKNKEIIAVN
jgi:alpha-galactosidase